MQIRQSFKWVVDLYVDHLDYTPPNRGRHFRGQRGNDNIVTVLVNAIDSTLKAAYLIQNGTQWFPGWFEGSLKRRDHRGEGLEPILSRSDEVIRVACLVPPDPE